MENFTPEQRLANAIVEQAATDFRKAAKKFHKNKRVVDERAGYVHSQSAILEMGGVTPKKRYIAQRHIERTQGFMNRHKEKMDEATGVINECERFFKSAWYKLLTSVDGDYLISELRKECNIAG